MSRMAIGAGFVLLAGVLMAGLAAHAEPTTMPTLPDRLRADVTMLATTIGERNLEHPEALERAATWVEARLAEATRLKVTREPYACDGKTVRNLYVDIVGTTKPQEIVVIGAHYDSVHGAPGANDNGSGVAALIELAGRFAGAKCGRTVRFVSFVNEEPPYFQTPRMGSVVHAIACKQRGEQIVGMIAFDTIGCFSDAPNSQHYPEGLAAQLPTVGNFIGIVADLDHRAFGERVAASMKRRANLPSHFAALPGQLPGVGWSDHWSFWQNGYDAVMITDTAPFRYADYHKATDTPDKIDYVRTANVVDATALAITDLSNAK